MRKRINVVAMMLGLLLCCLNRNVTARSEARQPYGVFTGMEPQQALQLGGYNLLIIDAAGFSEADVEALHQKSDKVYSYLNVGALEAFRDYFEAYSDLTLKPYENWPDEYWVNVADKRWQRLSVELADSYKKKGVDGLFLDNVDVYWHYPNEDVYKGLLAILRSIKKLKLPVIINGGDTFVRALLDRDELDDLIVGVNQESVFTSIDFSDGSFGACLADDNNYYLAYLAQVKAEGLGVYLIEYGADDAVQEIISKYCSEQGYIPFYAASLNLDRE